MHPGEYAITAPERAAVIMEPEGTIVTYRQLNERSNRFAHLLRSRGLGPGRCIAILAENRSEYFDMAWGAQRAGLYYVGLNSHLTTEEVAYIVRNSGAELIVVSSDLSDLAASVVDGTALASAGRLVLGGSREGWESYEEAMSACPATSIADETEGDFLLYSSGTTGRPKGIRRDLQGGAFGTYADPAGQWLRSLLGFVPGDVYLSPAPLYHAAPLGWSMAAHRSGGTVVVMRKFEPERALSLIEKYKVTHSQWVPTMFVRMLKLPPEVRARYDLSAMRHAVHAAAPCPVEVKRAMIDWWGPILYEYYSGTEAFGATAITSEEWLQKPGSVGRPLMGRPYVTDGDGKELPVGEVGTIWFRNGVPFEYHGDPGKTAAVKDDRGGVSVGDVGYLDSEGYLFLSDRRPHLIISGGVNIYPQEIEDRLIMHPDVLDVGVVGLPDRDMGERVVAAVQVRNPSAAGPELTAELIEYARQGLAGFKVPRELVFVDALPRTPTGKMRKYQLQEHLTVLIGH